MLSNGVFVDSVFSVIYSFRSTVPILTIRVGWMEKAVIQFYPNEKI